ncbi:MAG: hypothetical protein AAF441_21300 [Pseudomonadota bacterium]
MRNEIQFTDEQIEEHFDESPLGATIDEVVFTRDTLDDFKMARNDYREPGTVDDDNFGGFSALVIEGAQAAKGQPRKDIVVIDYGTVRAVLAL